MEGSKTVGFLTGESICRRVTVPLAGMRFMAGFNRPIFEPIQSNRQRFKRNRAPTARKHRVGSPYQHVP